MAFIVSHSLFTFLNMKMKLFYTYILLIALTLTGALLAGLPITKAIVIAIVLFSVLKFLIVAFQFMELKEAHIFWKVILTAYACIMGGLMMILL